MVAFLRVELPEVINLWNFAPLATRSIPDAAQLIRKTFAASVGRLLPLAKKLKSIDNDFNAE
jgi:hypothetical protein